MPGSAAVCFASSAAYQIAPFVDADHDALIDEPLAPGFLDRVLVDGGMIQGMAAGNH